jgi:hypothetical protein
MTSTIEEMETDARPRLNDPAVVDRIIRDFTTDVLGLVGRADFMGRCSGPIT